MAWRRGSATRKALELQRAWRHSLRAAIARDWSGAETWLERIVEVDSEDLDAYLALARLYREQGTIGRALRMHQNLLLRPDLTRNERTETLRELAADFEKGGFRERAVATYEEALGLEGGNPENLERLVSLLHELEEFPRALSLIRRLRRRNRPEADRLEVEILLSESRSLFENGDHDGARRSIKRCLRRNKGSASAWKILGELEVERGKTARALAAWKRAAIADAKVAAILYPKLAAGYAARGKQEEFEKFLQQLIEDRPQDCVARIALARARASRGNFAAAIEELTHAIDVAPADLLLRAELGRQLLAAGQEPEALKAYVGLVEVIERDSATSALERRENSD